MKNLHVNEFMLQIATLFQNYQLGTEKVGDISKVCQPDPSLHVYVVGGLSYRVSLHTQQRRVLKLIEDLSEALKSMSEVAVIGGGVAGITCAAALYRKGLQVSLYEQQRGLLPLQKKNTTRFIHPNAVTWPATAMESSTKLPFLNWHSGYSREVADIIEGEFTRRFSLEGNEGIHICTSTRVVKILPADDEFLIEYLTNSKTGNRSYQAVFIATGFQSERKLSGFDNFSYWEDTSPIPFSGKTKPRVAIIGDGDGALSELIRCAWPSAVLDELYRFVGERFIRRPEIKKDILVAEEEARREWGHSPEKAYGILSRIYATDCLTANGASYLRNRCELDCDLSLISRNEKPFSPKASPIHKILAGFLIRENLLKIEVVNAEEIVFTKGLYNVVGKSLSKADLTVGPYDRVLERLGPEQRFDDLVTLTFDADQLEKFSRQNAIAFDFANPTINEEINFTNTVDNDLDNETLAEITRSNLEIYFKNTYRNAIAVLSIIKGGDGNPKFLAEYNENSESIRRDGPSRYQGLEIIYQKFPGTPRALSGPLSMVLDDSDASVVSSDVLTVGQAIANISRSRDHMNVGRIAMFIRHEDDDQEFYFITALHAVFGAKNDKVGCVYRKSAPKRIGRIESTPFDRYLTKWQEDPSFNVLRDVLIVKLDDDVYFENRVGKNFVEEIRSAYDHLFEGDGKVWIKNRFFGMIENVRASIIIRGEEGREFRTDGFIVRKMAEHFDIKPGTSGQLVSCSNGDALGMLLAHFDDRIFCVDFSNVFKKLKCKIARKRKR